MLRRPFLGVVLVLVLSSWLTGPAAAQLLVAGDAGGDRLTFIDTAAGTVAGTSGVGAGPFDLVVTPDGQRIVVAASAGGGVEILDLATGHRTAVAGAGMPSAVALDPVGGRAFAVDPSTDSLAIIDLAAASVVTTVPVGAGPAAVASDGVRVYSANFSADTLTIVDGASGTVEATVPVGGFPAGVVADPGGGRVWVANYFEDTLSVVDPASATVVATIPVGPDPRALALDPVAGRLYVASFTAHTVTVVDTASNAVLGSAPTGGLNPIDLVLSPTGDRLFVLHIASPTLAVLDTATLATIATVAVPEGHVALAGFANGLPLAGVAEIPALGGTGLAFLAILLAGAGLVALHRWSQLAACLGITLALAAAGSAHAVPSDRGPAERGATFEITDGTFAPADWEVFQVTVGNGTHGEVQQTNGGNPGAFRQMTHSGLLLEIVHRYIGAGSTYDPATDGALTAVDVTWDRSIRTLDGGAAALLDAPVVIQGGQVFRTTFDLYQPPTIGTWDPFSMSGLDATAFNDGGGGHPDFSAAGGPITFGYVRRNGNSKISSFLVHGIDNFQVTASGGGGANAGTLRFRSSMYFTIDGETVDLVVQRVGGSSGAVSAVVSVPLFISGTEDLPVSWADGDSASKVVTAPAFGLAFPGEGIGSSEAQLVMPSGGAQIDPVRGKTLLFAAPEETGPLAILVLLLLLLFGASDPWLWLPLAALALYVAWRRLKAGATATRPASAP
ncbi:MAG: YncE family protein [Acidobacteria bacterium]|nr:YncE family protein [Acidobacteriota bacterium]